MSIEKNEQTADAETKCKSCRQFYGSQAFLGMCSTCYRLATDSVSKSNKQQPPKQEQTKIEIMNSPASTIGEGMEKIEKLDLDSKKEEIKVDRKRCDACKKKVGLLGNQCKCGNMYCNMHRLPEEHKCKFDHQKAAKQKLEKEIIKVHKNQIEDI